MSKINLIDVESGYNLSRINENFKEVKKHLDENVLYRNNPVGEPNEMDSDLDMNSKRIYNLPAPILPNEAARLQDVQEAIVGDLSASAISFVPYKTIDSINVQDAIAELKDELDTQAAIIPPASQIAFTPTSPMTSTNVQDAIDELAQGVIGSIDDANVKVIQPVTGAVQRTQHDVNSERISIKDFGAVGNGIADDTVALTNAWNSGKKVFFPSGRYKITSPISATGSKYINWEGEGNVVIDCTSVSTVGNVFTSEGALVQISNTSGNPGQHDQVVYFQSAHGLERRDVFMIYNPNDFSFSNHRSVYRGGEFAEVSQVSNSTQVKIQNKLYSGYLSNSVNAYKLVPTNVILKNLTFVAESNSAQIMYISLGRNIIIDNVYMDARNYLCLYLNRCYEASVTNCHMNNSGQSSDDYGLTIGNSQNVRVIGGTYHSRRHGITVGGSGGIGSIPNRNIRIIGATISNDTTSLVEAADFHGNCEDCHYIDCTVLGGYSVGGMNISIRGGFATEAGNGVVIGFSEVKGGFFSVSGVEIHAQQYNPSSNGRGIIYSYITAATTLELFTSIRDCKVIAGSNVTTSSPFMKADNNGNISPGMNITIEGITFDAPIMGAILQTRLVAGTASSRGFTIRHLSGNPPAGLVLHSTTGYESAPINPIA